MVGTSSHKGSMMVGTVVSSKVNGITILFTALSHTVPAISRTSEPLVIPSNVNPNVKVLLSVVATV